MKIPFLKILKTDRRVSLDPDQKKKLKELLFEEERNGERRVNRILLVLLSFLLFVMVLTFIVGEVSWKMLPNAIGFMLMSVYTVIVFLLLRKGVYKPFFKYLTISFCISMVTVAVAGYVPYSGWAHSLRTCTLLIHFIVIGMSGFYQNPKVSLFAGFVAAFQYTLHFFSAVFFSDTPIVHLETFDVPAISYDLLVVYALLLVFMGFIVSFVSGRLRVILEQSLHFEAEAHLKKELEIAHGKLKEMDRYKSDFFQNITHEFRTPLTLILGPLESLIGDRYGRLPAAAAGQLAVVRQNAARLLHLINQLLDLSKLDAKRMKLCIRPVDFSLVLDYIAASFESRAHGKNVGFVVDSKPMGIIAYLDREKIEKIVFNLLSNAFKFTESGGRIRLTAADRGETLEVKVADTGCGIPPGDLPYIFDRFRQADSSKTRQQGGTGIGLSIVREYARLHRGDVTVTSVPGEGSEFVLAVPKKMEAYTADEIDRTGASDEGTATEGYFVDDRTTVAVHARRADTHSGPADRKSVLIVEDNTMMQEFIRDSLAGQYEIFTADDGIEGLDRTRSRKPDLVISDIMMPGMDGNRLLRELKSDPETAEIPVVLLTARVSEDLRIEGLESGADDYLAKPFNPRELCARVDNIMKVLAQKKALAELNERLVRSENMKELLAGAVVHDIKNYASAIELSMKFLQKRYDGEPRTLRNIQAVRGSCTDIINLSLNLIDIRKMEEQGPAFQSREFSAVEIIGMAKKHVENPACEGKSVDVVYGPADDSFAVDADPFLFDRVLGNLFHNAFKYTPAGGKVALEFLKTETGSSIRLFNSGEPVPEEQRTVLFEKYIRLREGRSTYSRGLGLCFCKMAMEAHGGRIWVEPSAEGNTFILEFARG